MSRKLLQDVADAYTKFRVSDDIDALDDAMLAIHEALARPEPDGIDTEAIAWAYQKLLAFGVGSNNGDSAMMLDRLNLMLLESSEVSQ